MSSQHYHIFLSPFNWLSAQQQKGANQQFPFNAYTHTHVYFQCRRRPIVLLVRALQTYTQTFMSACTYPFAHAEAHACYSREIALSYMYTCACVCACVHEYTTCIYIHSARSSNPPISANYEHVTYVTCNFPTKNEQGKTR